MGEGRMAGAGYSLLSAVLEDMTNPRADGRRSGTGSIKLMTPLKKVDGNFPLNSDFRENGIQSQAPNFDTQLFG